VIEWLATLNEDVDTCALSPLKLAVPSEVAPSKNSKFPVGEPEPGELTLTFAVNVTD